MLDTESWAGKQISIYAIYLTQPLFPSKVVHSPMHWYKATYLIISDEAFWLVVSGGLAGCGKRVLDLDNATTFSLKQETGHGTRNLVEIPTDMPCRKINKETNMYIR